MFRCPHEIHVVIILATSNFCKNMLGTEGGKMKISIIVLLYNHERYIQECLESIKYQTEKYNCNKAHTVQVIIADDASSDGSKKAVEDWSSRNKY